MTHPNPMTDPELREIVDDLNNLAHELWTRELFDLQRRVVQVAARLEGATLRGHLLWAHDIAFTRHASHTDMRLAHEMSHEFGDHDHYHEG